MNTYLRLAAGVAVLAILGAGAIYFAGPQTGPGSQPTASPSPIPASASPGTSKQVSSVTFRPGLTLRIPTAWQVNDLAQAFTIDTTGNDANGAPAGTIEFRGNPVVGNNANDCEGLAASGVGTSVDEITAALTADPRFATADAGTVILDGRSARMLDVRLSPTWTATCSWSGSKAAALLLTVATPPGPFVGLIGDERIRVILLDVGGVVLAITVGTSDTPYSEVFVTDVMPFVESVTFTP